eukprot:4062549-Pyramimonas_sp.AAC.1
MATPHMPRHTAQAMAQRTGAATCATGWRAFHALSGERNIWRKLWRNMWRVGPRRPDPRSTLPRPPAPAGAPA